MFYSYNYFVFLYFTFHTLKSGRLITIEFISNIEEFQYLKKSFTLLHTTLSDFNATLLSYTL